MTTTSPRKPINPLPEKLSALIRVALADLAKVERSKKYQVDMGMWHGPRRAYNPATGTIESSGPCCVCFAGAVMACEFRLEPTENEDVGFSPKNWQKFYALNAIRVGNVNSALDEFYKGRKVPKALEQFSLDDTNVVPYH